MVDSNLVLIGVLGVIGNGFILYNLFHFVLYQLAIHPRRADEKGVRLNEFEQRQLTEWQPKLEDFLKHDDENRSYDDIFQSHPRLVNSYNSCVFPRSLFSNPHDADLALLEPRDGMRFLDLGCGGGGAADHIASRADVTVHCVTNAAVQAEICRVRCARHNGRVNVEVADFDEIALPKDHFDAVLSLESVGYTKDLDRWLRRCFDTLKPGGRLLIRSPASLENCRRLRDYENVTAFFENWRYNFVGANILIHKMRKTGFVSIRYRQLPFFLWGLTWNFIQKVIFWKFIVRMRTMVGMEQIIWNTSKAFVFGNVYNIVIAVKPTEAGGASAESVGQSAKE